MARAPLRGAIVLVALARRRPRLAVGAFVLVLGANVTTRVLKRYVLPPAYAWARLVATLLVEERGPGPTQRSRPAGGRLFLSARLGILAVAFAVLLAVGATQYSDDLSIPTPDRAFAAGALTVGGLGALLVGASLWLLRGVSLDAPREDATYTVPV